jgi:hypothetical protein
MRKLRKGTGGDAGWGWRGLVERWLKVEQWGSYKPGAVVGHRSTGSPFAYTFCFSNNAMVQYQVQCKLHQNWSLVEFLDSVLYVAPVMCNVAWVRSLTGDVR